MTQPTPTPWQVLECQNEVQILACGGARKIAVMPWHGNSKYAEDDLKDKINAKLIVKAVNCHDDLVEALNSVLRDGQDNRVIDMETWEKAKQAIKKAES